MAQPWDAANKAPYPASAQSLPANLLAQQTFGFTSRHNLNVSADHAFATKEEDYADRKFHLPCTTRSTFLMVFSPNGKLVASTHGDHIIYVSEVATGKCVRQLAGHPRTPWCLAFHPNNNDLLASGCLGGQVRVWDLCGGSEIWSSGGQTVIASIAFHPTSDCLLVIATHNEIHFWDWNKKTPFMKIATKHEKERVRFVTFDSTGHKLITGIANRLLYTTPLLEQQAASDDSEPEDLSQSFRPNRTHASAEDRGNPSNAHHSNIIEVITSRSSDGFRLMHDLMTGVDGIQRPGLRSTSFSTLSSFDGQSASTSAAGPRTPGLNMGQVAGRELRLRHLVTFRRSSMSPQSRRRMPVFSSPLARSESNGHVAWAQQARGNAREFYHQLVSLLNTYTPDMSSDSENEGVEPDQPINLSPHPMVRQRAAAAPTLNERYRRFRPLRVGRWNTNLIAQGNLIVHSPNDPSGSSRQPSAGYIFANLHVNHRIQCWTFSESNFPPDVSDSSKNVVVPRCKINNDSSVSISSCDQFLAAIIPECQSHQVKISIYSVCKDSLGHKLFTFPLTQNVVSISFSPSAHFLLVGFATNRLLAFRRERYPMAKIFRLPFGGPELLPSDGARALEQVKCVMQQTELTYSCRGINCMRWAPVAGQGVVYGTNTGELGILQ